MENSALSKIKKREVDKLTELTELIEAYLQPHLQKMFLKKN